MQEEIIMSSNDNSITLTTHRIFQKTSEINKEILLSDLLSYEVIGKRHNYYLFLSFLFGIPLLCLGIYCLVNPEYVSGEGYTLNILVLLFIPTAVALYFHFTSKNKYLRISGRFNSIDFPLKNMKEESLHSFLNRLQVESDNRKKGN